MIHKFLQPTLAFILTVLISIPTFAQEAEMAAHHEVLADGLEYADLELPGFDPGIKLAAIHGDPAAAGEPYVIRLSFPDGYRFPAHYHPNAENLTVLEGTFLLAMGREVDASSLKRYSPGDFLHIPAEHPHFGGATGETVIQLHGMGPFEVLLVEEPVAN